MRKVVLITGGSGFLGRHLALKLKDCYEVVLASRNNGNNQIAQEITGCKTIPLDVSNMNSVKDTVNEIEPSIIIHAAATKYVDISEKNPFECIDINVQGSENIARIAIDKKVETVIGISTDKTAPPVGNIYGHTKAIMERMYIALNGKTETKFACTRFGNIAWSTGSVLPIWKRMFERDKHIKTTGPEMRRFFFTVEEAADLVIRSLENIDSVQGNILCQKMKAAQIQDILDVWIELFGGTWEKVQTRPGDKLDEYLIGELELPYTQTININNLEHYLISFNKKVQNQLTKVISSENAQKLDKSEIEIILQNPPTFM